jgi:hypothetical protein
MSMWNHISAEDLIRLSQNGNYGLAPGKWRAQLAELRGLPETERPDDEKRKAA